MVNIGQRFKTAGMWAAVRGEMTAVHSCFNDVLNTQYGAADYETVNYALKHLQRKIREMMGPAGNPERSTEEYVHNVQWDMLRGERLANWLGKKVGPDVCDPATAFPFNLYLQTISVAADATYHRHAPVSNIVLSVAYARLLPIAAFQHTQIPHSKERQLQSYVLNLGQVWDAAAYYPDHQRILKAELEAQIENLNRWKWWPGLDGNPAYSAYRSEIQHIIAPGRR